MLNELQVARMFDASIDDNNNTIEVFGGYFPPSLVLKRLDSMAYYTELHQFADNLARQGSYQVEGYEE